MDSGVDISISPLVEGNTDYSCPNTWLENDSKVSTRRDSHKGS